MLPIAFQTPAPKPLVDQDPLSVQVALLTVSFSDRKNVLLGEEVCVATVTRSNPAVKVARQSKKASTWP